MMIDDWYFSDGWELSKFELPNIGFKLCGYVRGSDEVDDGRLIKTYPVVKLGRVVETSDGCVWELGRVDSLYKEYLRNEGLRVKDIKEAA